MIILFILVGYFSPIGFLITTGFRFSNGIMGLDCSGCAWYIQFNTWEWLLLVGILVDFILFLWLTPELNKKEEAK